MKLVKSLFDSARPSFVKGGKLERLEPIFRATETFFFIPGVTTRNDAHIRDNLDLKRFMSIVILALMPPFLFGIYNSGYQSLAATGATPAFADACLRGLWIVMPLVIVSYAVGFFWEFVFAVVRKHEISEGLLVTGLLFPMTLPPTIPLWQAALGISFGVVIGKEIFGGTGRNIMNPALTGRAFLFFAYPGKMSGDAVWVSVRGGLKNAVDTFSGATPLACVDPGIVQQLESVLNDAGFTLQKLFFGLHPGSIGETSALMCLIGAVLLIATGVASYRIIVGGVLGLLAIAVPGYLLSLSGHTVPSFFTLNPAWHLVMGGFALGIVYMATDPVSAPGMEKSRWIYGFGIGVMTVLIRAFNPAFPEGVMLAILFMNLFSPLIDYFVIKTRLRKRIPNV